MLVNSILFILAVVRVTATRNQDGGRQNNCASKSNDEFVKALNCMEPVEGYEVVGAMMAHLGKWTTSKESMPRLQYAQWAEDGTVDTETFNGPTVGKCLQNARSGIWYLTNPGDKALVFADSSNSELIVEWAIALLGIDIAVVDLNATYENLDAIFETYSPSFVVTDTVDRYNLLTSVSEKYDKPNFNIIYLGPDCGSISERRTYRVITFSDLLEIGDNHEDDFNAKNPREELAKLKLASISFYRIIDSKLTVSVMEYQNILTIAYRLQLLIASKDTTLHRALPPVDSNSPIFAHLTPISLMQRVMILAGVINQNCICIVGVHYYKAVNTLCSDLRPSVILMDQREIVTIIPPIYPNHDEELTRSFSNFGGNLQLAIIDCVDPTRIPFKSLLSSVPTTFDSDFRISLSPLTKDSIILISSIAGPPPIIASHKPSITNCPVCHTMDPMPPTSLIGSLRYEPYPENRESGESGPNYPVDTKLCVNYSSPIISYLGTVSDN